MRTNTATRKHRLEQLFPIHISDQCDWAVAYEIDGKEYDDGIPYRCVTAWFRNPINAEDFIRTVLPNRDRFFVIQRGDLRHAGKIEFMQSAEVNYFIRAKPGTPTEENQSS